MPAQSGSACTRLSSEFKTAQTALITAPRGIAQPGRSSGKAGDVGRFDPFHRLKAETIRALIADYFP
jgi:hypothetical protein